MKRSLPAALATLSLVLCANLYAQTGPWVDNAFQGRIALSHDGNFNDEDDWGALPVIAALLDAYGLMNKVVHVDFNNIIQDNDARFEAEMTASVLGAAQRYDISASVLHNCLADLDGAVASIRDAVNASSAQDPLYYLLAGPMDVAYHGILAADPAKRRYVYCISHSVWNDGFGNRTIEGRSKRDVIQLGINWIQVQPGRGLTYSTRTASTPEQWAAFHWMRGSSDPRLQWIYSRLEAEGRCDVSDATIAYSFLTGDERCDPAKLAALLDKKQKPALIAIRPTIRLEAENFDSLENCLPVYGDRQVSHRVFVRIADRPKAAIRTSFHEIHVAQSGRYQAGVRYRVADGGAATFTLRINGSRQGANWNVSAGNGAWETHTVDDVFLVLGDEVAVEVEAEGPGRAELDYLQLDYQGPDDAAAMSGQIIVDPANPHRLKLNGGKRCFFFGAGNPEDFFFLGTRQSDGTRTGGRQEEIIKKIVGTGANTFHVLALRDSRYNLEPGNGAPDCNPFDNADISGRLDEDILRQWEGWLQAFEADGIVVLFTFYNDFDDYEELAGWKLDAAGNLHPQEEYFIKTLVERFKHHKNIIWVINESCNKLSRAKQTRLKKVADLVAKTDNFHHPIGQIFQILYYDEVHPDKVSPEDYVKNSSVRMMAWGHYATKKKGLPSAEQYYRELVGHVREAAGRYVLFDMEVDRHPSAGAESRLYSWTAAMAGVYAAMNSHRPDKATAPRATFEDDGRICAFLERTNSHSMSPRSDLKSGSTLYVLANEPDSYIAYSPDASENMGLCSMQAGTYLLRWFDTTNGNTVEQVIAVSAGDRSWARPPGIGSEAALYVKRLPGVVLEAVDAALSSGKPLLEDERSHRPWRTLPLVTRGTIDANWKHLWGGGFAVMEDGSLRTDGSDAGMGLLLYTKERLGNCQIRVVYRSEDDRSNAGIFVRIDEAVLARANDPPPPRQRGPNGRLIKETLERIEESSEQEREAWYPVHHGYEVQICGAGDEYHRTGAVYSLAPAAPAPAKPPADWKTMVITLQGNLILVDVDGKRLTTFDPDSPGVPLRKHWSEPRREPKRPLSGYIGLQNHDPGDVVYFKEVSVRPWDGAH